MLNAIHKYARVVCVEKNMKDTEGNYIKRIVVGGVPRSGSTLLRFILDTSDSIIAGPETGFFLQPLSSHQTRLERVSNKIAEKLDIPSHDVSKAIISNQSSFSAYDDIMKIYSEHVGVGKKCWAEKTPRNCLHYHRLSVENPEAYFISTIRHGLDIVTSKRDVRRKGEDEFWCSPQTYADLMSCIFSFNSPKHLIIKYEDLVTDPTVVLDKLSSFLNMEFPDSILEEFNQETKTKDFSKVRQPKLVEKIQKTWIGRWQKAEYGERVDSFMEHSQALHWLKFAGYSF